MAVKTVRHVKHPADGRVQQDSFRNSIWRRRVMFQIAQIVTKLIQVLLSQFLGTKTTMEQLLRIFALAMIVLRDDRRLASVAISGSRFGSEPSAAEANQSIRSLFTLKAF